MACAKMVEEPVFFEIMAGAENQAPGGEVLREFGWRDFLKLDMIVLLICP